MDCRVEPGNDRIVDRGNPSKASATAVPLADVTNPDASADWAMPLSHHISTGASAWSSWMRSLFALSLLISLVAPAAAATVHHSHVRHHAVVRSDPPFIVRPGEGEAVPPGWYKFPGYPAIPPSENRNLDPSNFGGG